MVVYQIQTKHLCQSYCVDNMWDLNGWHQEHETSGGLASLVGLFSV